MKVSLALCTFNSSKFLQEQLDSFLRQTHLPDELVVCDNHSEDNTIALLKKFQETAPFPVRIFENGKNLGFNKNFEKAISLCEGDIIFPSDSDDIWLEEKIQKMLLPFADPQVALVLSDEFLADAQAKNSGDTFWQSNGFHQEEKELFLSESGTELLLHKTITTGHSLALRASLREKIMPIPATYMYDAWIIWLAKLFAKVALVEEPLVLYRRHESQSVGVLSSGKWQKLSQRFQRMRSQARERSAAIAKESELLLEQIKKLNPDFVPAEQTSQIQKRAQFFHEKSRLPSGRIARIPFIAKCLFGGQYNRYENGVISALKDFLL